MSNQCKTKIIATIGPSSWDLRVLKGMISNGMDIARINASFADKRELDRVSSIIRELSFRTALMLDTQGHKVRVSGFKEDRVLDQGDSIIIVPEKYFETELLSEKYISTSYPS